MLRPGVHFLPVFLVDESDSDILCLLGKPRVQVIQFCIGFGQEKDTREGNHSCPTGGGCKAVFTGLHCKEEGATDDVSGVGICRGLVTCVGKLKKSTEELWSYGSLARGRGINSVETLEERPDRGKDPSAAFNVKGAWFEFVPKHRSQIACSGQCSIPQVPHGIQKFALIGHIWRINLGQGRSIQRAWTPNKIDNGGTGYWGYPVLGRTGPNVARLGSCTRGNLPALDKRRFRGSKNKHREG
jgi:hypothetical protein